MRKRVNTNEGIADLLGMGSIKSVKGSSRKRMLNDALYYIRKLLKIVRSVQAIPEGTADPEIRELEEEFKALKVEFNKIEI